MQWVERIGIYEIGSIIILEKYFLSNISIK